MTIKMQINKNKFSVANFKIGGAKHPPNCAYDSTYVFTDSLPCCLHLLLYY